MANLWNYDEPIMKLTKRAVDSNDWPNVPDWIEQDITPADVAAIVQGGCASGAYMPAVVYHDALRTMGEYGDEVLQYIEDCSGGDDPLVEASVVWINNYDRGISPPSSWAGLACYFVSRAVELWASSVEDELSDLLDELEEEADEDDERGA